MYSSLAVLVQSIADVEIVRRLGPSVFYPRPVVDSAIVRIVPNAEKRAKVGDVAAFRVFLRDLYSHRRKNLRGALVGWPSGRREKSDVDRILGELGLDGRGRAEELDIEQHLRLCAAFQEKTATDRADKRRSENH
jgi:16S rRNA (adenine1518-N6/adenine1519-N6)-dimethyltransferase